MFAFLFFCKYFPESRAPILVGKKVQHTFNEGTHNGKVISTVPGFPDFYNIIYDSELDIGYHKI
jgi:hypothetical protein